MLGHGTTHVRVKAINPYSFGSAEPFFAASQPRHHSSPIGHIVHDRWRASLQHSQKFNCKGYVYLQVGAFRNKLYAEKLQKRLSSIFSAPVKISANKNQLYKVKIGPFQNAATLNQISHQLHRMGMNADKVNFKSIHTSDI